MTHSGIVIDCVVLGRMVHSLPTGSCPTDGLGLDLVSTDDQDTLREGRIVQSLPKGRFPVSPTTQSFIVMDCVVLGAHCPADGPCLGPCLGLRKSEGSNRTYGTHLSVQGRITHGKEQGFTDNRGLHSPGLHSLLSKGSLPNR